MDDPKAGASSIPAMLRELQRWLTWCLTKRGKQPQEPNSAARVRELLAWKDVEDLELSATAGIGFSFVGGVQLDDGSYLGALDADSCRNPLTGELASWVERVLKKCKRTYTSISVSGTGLHIWIRLPEMPAYIPKLIPKGIDADDYDKRPNLQLFGYGVAHYVTESGHQLPGTSNKIQLLPDLDFLTTLNIFEPVADHSQNGAELALPTGVGEAPSMEEIREAVASAPNGVALMNAQWADLGFKSASECAWDLSRHVLRAAQNHGDAAVEFITDHTPWGLGHVDALEPDKYMKRSRWAKDLCRAVLKGIAEKEPVKFEPVEKTKKEKPKRKLIEPVSMCMADVEPREIKWLWRDRLALGRLSLLSAPPGAGKSYLTCFMSACVSNGDPWPDGAECDQGQVVLVTCEDDPHDTVRPRLDACGANLRAVHMLAGVKRIDPHKETESVTAFTFDDLRPLDVLLKSLGNVRLVVIDPIGSYFGGKKDSFIDTEVRAVLAPLADLARANNCAVLLVAHTRKSGAGSADDMVMGSRAFTGLSRSVYHIFRDPENKHRRFLLPGKNNIGEELPGLAFELVGRPQPSVLFDPEPIDTPADELAAKLVRANRKVAGGRNPPGATDAWLLELLSVRGRPASEVLKMAETAGLAKRSVQRAADRLGVVPQKKGFGGSWFWALPNQEEPRATLADLRVEGARRPHLPESSALRSLL